MDRMLHQARATRRDRSNPISCLPMCRYLRPAIRAGFYKTEIHFSFVTIQPCKRNPKKMGCAPGRRPGAHPIFFANFLSTACSGIIREAALNPKTAGLTQATLKFRQKKWGGGGAARRPHPIFLLYFFY